MLLVFYETSYQLIVLLVFQMSYPEIKIVQEVFVLKWMNSIFNYRYLNVYLNYFYNMHFCFLLLLLLSLTVTYLF